MKEVDGSLKPFQIAFSGNWKPVFDGTQILQGDFQVLTNIRYLDDPGVRGIFGISKINTTGVGVATATWNQTVDTLPHVALSNNPDDVVGENYNPGSHPVSVDSTGMYVTGWKAVSGTPNKYQAFVEKRSLTDGTIIWQKFLDQWNY